MAYTPATKTLKLIEDSMYKDQGARFREIQKDILPKMTDAYQGHSDDHRSHFGFSNAADSCARKLWYSFNWSLVKKFKARILRLFNRGHLEEGRFISMLMACDLEVHFETEDGGQFKLEDHNGHAGSAIDAVVIGIPDLEPNTPALVEMKTHSKKSFMDVVRKGVKESKPVQYGQMQIYMKKYDLMWGLYMAVNKDDDDLHLELIVKEPMLAERLIERAGMIIYATEIPPRLNDSPGWYECKFCDYKGLCHQKDVPEINCRTCVHSSPIADKKWHCSYYDKLLSKSDQLKGCAAHLYNPALLNGADVVKGDPDDGWYTMHWKDHRITLGPVTEQDACTGEYITSQDLKDGKF